MVRPCNVFLDAFKAHIWAAFTSRWIAWSLCIGPPSLGAGAFFDRAVASIWVGPLEMSLPFAGPKCKATANEPRLVNTSI
jgi:hypothetical protein